MKNFDRSLPMMLYRTLHVVMPAFRKIFADYGLTEQQWRVLRVLWEHGSVSLLELGTHSLISPPSLVGIVDRLSKAGLVRRVNSESDRRIVFVEATEKGVALEKEVSPRVDEIYGRLEGGVDPKLWKTMFMAMDQIIAGEVETADDRDTAA